MPCACAILSSVACPAIDYFPLFLTHAMIFEKKNIEHKTCVFIFSTAFVYNISSSKKNRTRYDQKCVLVFM